MRLEGSCHCGSVRFAVESDTPYPYMECYCSICRKTAGGGGFAINLGAHSRTLEVEGGEHVRIYHAKMDGGESQAERHFCGVCGSALWVYSPHWPELVHPFASAIDTPLPRPPEKVRIMLGYAAPWCDVPEKGDRERHFPEYPDESIADWHRRHGLYGEPEGEER